MPSTQGFTQHKDLLEIQWKNSGETGGGDYEKWNALPKMEKKANSNGGIMKNEMPSLLLDEKICFIRLHAYMVNRLVTEHLVSQLLLSHSICLLSTSTLKVKYSPLERAPMVVQIVQNWSKMRKIHSFKVGGNWFKKMDWTHGSPWWLV